ncbi:MAG: 1,4-dihydroxy-2-naphthoate octaprenyltransferase, partial [Candidatus Eiseniibacteriota bacterium]
MTESVPDASAAPAAPAALAAHLPHPSRARAWLHACRFPTLAASVVPVLVGSALAWRHGVWHPATALAAMIGAVAIQLGTNFANDLYDFRKGADPAERIGPPRVLAQGWLEPTEIRSGMIAAFAIATLAGLYLVRVAGWPVIAIGVASIAAGIGYTAGRFALAYNALGDVAVYVFFGFVAVLGTYYVQAHALHPEAVLAAISVGALATAILV